MISWREWISTFSQLGGQRYTGMVSATLNGASSSSDTSSSNVGR